MKNKWFLFSIILLLFFQINYLYAKEKKKVFYVNSYHRGYPWSDDITFAILKKFNVKMDKKGNIDDTKSFVNFRIVYMDTKLHTNEAYKQMTAIKIKNMIDIWNPDVIITSSDSAIKYLIEPYYKNSKIPVVFCGINMDASMYGLPYKNTTGIIEIPLLDTGYKILKPYMKKNKVCSLSLKKFSDYNIIGMSKIHSGLSFDATFATSYENLKKAFIDTQNKCGLLYITEPFSIEGFNVKEYKKFIYDNIKIPVFATQEFIKELALLTVAVIPEEQGEWAANAAIRILNGEKPNNIPIAKNKKAQIYLNMKLAKKLNIIFPISIVEEAAFTGENNIP